MLVQANRFGDAKAPRHDVFALSRYETRAVISSGIV
jgi:hypothetical protein